MRSLTRNALALLAVLVLLPSTAFAQLGTLQGVATDTTGAVLPGVTVEAASPVLIEGVRVTVTSGEGRYTIIGLRPGTYTVTFTLPGFATVTQEDVAISTAGASNVDAAMRVGGLEETVTVTGEAPVVDVTTATRAAVLSADTVDALPTSRNYLGLARLIPGTGSGGTDVGGSRTQEVGGQVGIHGSRGNDQRVMLNGVPTQTLQAGGGLGGQVPDVGSAAEVTIEHTAVSADISTGGLRINFVPRDGGNTFSTSAFFTGSNSSLQGSNFTSELEAAGLTTPNEINKNWDVNFAFGGPIAQDKVWFWFSGRRNVAQFYVPVFGNANAYDPNKYLYVEDRNVRGEEKGQLLQSSLRLTWQASARNKIAGTVKKDRWCTCPETGNPGSEKPEANEDFRFPRLSQYHLEWTSPVSNNLLLEAVGLHLFERWGNMHPHQTGPLHSLSDNATAIANASQLISINDRGYGYTYGLNNSFNNTLVPNYAWRVAGTYVTGTHNVKVGVNGVSGFLAQTQYLLNNMSYEFRNGVPNRVRLDGKPTFDKSEQNADLGVFIQDTITLDRLTIGAAVRYDMFQTGYEAGVMGPSQFTPERNFSFAAGDILDFTDVTYRSSITYDLRGDGRTAIKVTANKYLEGQTLNGIGRAGHPVARLQNNTTIDWVDADGDFIPDCDLMNRAANGECGKYRSSGFGSLRPSQSYSNDLLSGFGNREANWEYSVGIQQELMTGVSVDVGYFRRNWQNLAVRDNRALDASDFTFFDITVPTDARLPNSGATLTGFRAITAAGQAKHGDNLNIRAKEIGEFGENWQGVDVSLNARLQNGLQLQLGTSTGRTAFNDCALEQKLPERDLGRAFGFCDRAEPYLTEFKGYAVYTIPTVDVQVAATYRSVPGRFVNANFNMDNTFLAAHSTLGRALTGSANTTLRVQLLEPHTKTLNRRNELDLRLGKIIRIGGARAVASVDIFNAMNSGEPLRVNETFGSSYMSPRSILDARLAKFSLQFDF